MAKEHGEKAKRKREAKEAVVIAGTGRIYSPICPHCSCDIRERPAPRVVPVDPRQTSFLEPEG